jgi:hypothetical protein
MDRCFSGTLPQGVAWTLIGTPTAPFDPRLGPSFAAPTLLVEPSTLLVWSSGALQADGSVVDVYSSPAGGADMLISGNPRSLQLYGTPAQVTLSTHPGVTGSANASGVIEFPGAVVSAVASQSSTPFFLPNQTSLWVDDVEYGFTGGYLAGDGGRVDHYHHASLGYLRLAGEEAGAAAVTGSHLGASLSGTLSSGGGGEPVFSMNGTHQVGIEPPPGEPDKIGPDGLWVRGRIYTRQTWDEEHSHYQAAGAAGNCALIREPDGYLTLSGADSIGSFSGQVVAGGVGPNNELLAAPRFVEDASGELTVLVLGLNAEGAFLAGSAELPSGLPAAVRLPPEAVQTERAYLSYLGTASCLGSAAAVFFNADHPEADVFLLIDVAPSPEPPPSAPSGSGLARVVNCSSSEWEGQSAWFDPASRLFQVETAAAEFPRPLLPVATDEHNKVWWHASWPEPSSVVSDLGPSFLVRGQAWFYAGLGNGDALYFGPVIGQMMTVEPPQSDGGRLVSLVDPVWNAAQNRPAGFETRGTYNPERHSIVFRDGTVAVRGNEQGGYHTEGRTDSLGLHTIDGDLDILGNHLSFGLLEGDASLAGMLFRFTDAPATQHDPARAALHQVVSRTRAEWWWHKAGSSNSAPTEPVMHVGADHSLRLHPPSQPPPEGAPPDGDSSVGLRLNPVPGGTSSIPGVLRVRPGGDLSMGDFGTGTPP